MIQKVLVCTCSKCSCVSAADAVPKTVAESGPRCNFGAGYTRRARQSPQCRQGNSFLSESILIPGAVTLKCFITVVFAAEISLYSPVSDTLKI